MSARKPNAPDQIRTSDLRFRRLTVGRLPDLAATLREASPEVQRQVFVAFELQLLYDKTGRTIEISATVSDAVASASEKQKALLKEGLLVVPREVAGSRSVPRYDATRIHETNRNLAY